MLDHERVGGNSCGECGRTGVGCQGPRASAQRKTVGKERESLSGETVKMLALAWNLWAPVSTRHVRVQDGVRVQFRSVGLHSPWALSRSNSARSMASLEHLTLIALLHTRRWTQRGTAPRVEI